MCDTVTTSQLVKLTNTVNMQYIAILSPLFEAMGARIEECRYFLACQLFGQRRSAICSLPSKAESAKMTDCCHLFLKSALVLLRTAGNHSATAAPSAP